MEQLLYEYIMFGAAVLSWILYHTWYFYRLRYYPHRTITGWTRHIRRKWVLDTIKRQGGPILAVQTLRNWILAATLLATASITLALSVLTFLASASRSPISSPYLESVANSPAIEFKTILLLIVYMSSFFCFANSTRYFNHVGMSINVTFSDAELEKDQSQLLESGIETGEHVAILLNRGNAWFSAGLRFIYLSFPCLLWFFSPPVMLMSNFALIIAIHLGDLS